MIRNAPRRNIDNVRRRELRLFSLGPALLLGSCVLNRVPVLSTDGPVASTERDLLFVAVGLMLIVVIPVFVMTGYFTWHYRASNTRARYMPEWSSSWLVEAPIWLIPIAIVAALSAMVYVYSHRLDPYRALASGKPPLQVEAISLDWKWLFIYPQQHLATVNDLVIPSGRPVSMKLTSDTVMDSLYIPALAGQIYTMAGMQTRLHMLASKPGCFTGRNTNFSGRDFADQRFAVHAVPAAKFRAWVARVRRTPKALDAANYARLARPGTSAAAYYSAIEPNLFDKVIAKYSPAMARRLKNKERRAPPASPPKKALTS